MNLFTPDGMPRKWLFAATVAAMCGINTLRHTIFPVADDTHSPMDLNIRPEILDGHDEPLPMGESYRGDVDKIGDIADIVVAYQKYHDDMELNQSAIAYIKPYDDLLPYEKSLSHEAEWGALKVDTFYTGIVRDRTINLRAAIKAAKNVGAENLLIVQPDGLDETPIEAQHYQDNWVCVVKVEKLDALVKSYDKKAESLGLEDAPDYELSWYYFNSAATVFKKPDENFHHITGARTASSIRIGLGALTFPFHLTEFFGGHELAHVYFETTTMGRNLAKNKSMMDMESLCDSTGLNGAANREAVIAEFVVYGAALNFGASPFNDVENHDRADRYLGLITKAYWAYGGHFSTHPSLVQRFENQMKHTGLEKSNLAQFFETPRAASTPGRLAP